MWLLSTLGGALATTWTPLRVALDCQSQQRVEACTYVRGALDTMDVVAVVPLSDAQVVLYLNATAAAATDFVLLRAVADPARGVIGGPATFEQTASVDSRMGVDEQRAALLPALNRVLAPYVSLAVPDAVGVTFTAPEEEAAPLETTPWGFSLWGGGYGRWSRDYQYLTVWSGVSTTRLTNENAFTAWAAYDRSVELQPDLVVDDHSVALTSDSSAVVGLTAASWNVTDHWTVGGVLRGGHQDPQGQYLGTARAGVGVEYNLFPSDDPRGNAVAVGYLLSGQADWYNQENTLGQLQAVFPTQALVAGGTVRVDTVSLSLSVAAKTQLYPFVQRYVVDASLSTDLTLGDHVDLSFQVDGTQQAIPGPADIDTSSYEEVTRASYAEPLQMNGMFNLRFHWDNTNSARNNRFETVTSEGPTDAL